MKIDTQMFGPIDIATSGLKAYNKQMETIASNMAHARTSDAGNGEPYRRLETIFKAKNDGISLVEVADVVGDKSAFQQILNPGHPDADANGYVSMPNVNVATELINLNVASRAYQANAAILKRYQKMVETSLELLK